MIPPPKIKILKNHTFPKQFWHYTRLALRQPVICLPMLSINKLISACFFMESIFISTHRRISNFINSKSSKNASKYSTLFYALLALKILRTKFIPSRFISCPSVYLYSLGKSLVTSNKTSINLYTSLKTGKS